jgi:nicotinic acid phosphoribosyltransferase
MEANFGNPGFSGLATDLYQLTMAAAYHANGRNDRASFELFTRKLPPGRSYLIVAGLEQALDYLRGLSFSTDEIEYLRRNFSITCVTFVSRATSGRCRKGRWRSRTSLCCG